MNATPEPHGPVDPELEAYAYEDEDFAETMPVRPRRPFLTKWTAGLMALTLGGVGFYVGVRVEKSKIPATSGSGSGASAFARALGGATGSKSGAGSLASRFGGGGAGGFAGALGGAGNDTVGSVSSVNGRTIYVTSTAGNTVKVKLSSATTITKSESVGRGKLYPGDEVVITGVKGSGGSVTATTVTDSGARSSGASSTSSTSSGSTSSAISSLFGGG